MKKFDIITYRNPQFAKCPGCGKSASLHRSRAKNMREQIIKRITFYSIYRCNDCGWRGYLSTLTFTRNSFKSFIIYVILIFVTAYVVKFLLTKFLV